MRSFIKNVGQQGTKASVNDKETATYMELAVEMLARGFEFEDVDLYRSDAHQFIVTDKGLLPPLGAIGGIGGVAAENIVKARSKGPFISREDLRNRAKISNTAVEVLADLGALKACLRRIRLNFFEGFPLQGAATACCRGFSFWVKKGEIFPLFVTYTWYNIGNNQKIFPLRKVTIMKIRFLGADKVVTGSCHMLEVGSKKILLDCGMFQGPKLIRSLNRKPFAFHPGEIDAVVLSHAHVDHSGLLPRLVKEGFKGPIYCTHVTKELCEILLPDCGHIQEQDAEIETRKGLRKGKEAVTPLYTVDDAYLALKQFVCHDYDENFEICDGVTIRFRVAGHILGSALVNVIVRENGKETKLIYTGDIGQPNVPILDDPHQLSGADFIITESTYGNRVHETADREAELLEIIKDALSRGGNIIIPAFAVGRTQVMLYYFQKLMSSGKLPTVPIMVDSPMAIKATKVMLFNPDEYDEEARSIYQKQGGRLIDMPNVHYTETPEESRAINDMPSPMIIISASGMADAGACSII